jgi:hypothetical protein
MRKVLVWILASLPAIVIAACSSSASPAAAEADPGAPPAPSGLAATPMGAGIHLSWKDNSSDEAEFQIERRDASGAYTKIATVTFDVVQYHDTSVTAARRYAYRTRAVSSGGARSGYSNEVVLEAPAGATGADTMSAGVGWDGGAVSFQAHIIPFFEKSCGAGNTLCHSRDAYGAAKDQACRGWLTLENASLGAKFYSGDKNGQATGCPDRSLYDRLTQLDAWQEPNGQTRKYIKPGDPQNSYLFNKMAGGPYGEDRPGVLSSAMPPAPRTITANDVAMMKQWIESGAPR